MKRYQDYRRVETQIKPEGDEMITSEMSLIHRKVERLGLFKIWIDWTEGGAVRWFCLPTMPWSSNRRPRRKQKRPSRKETEI
jgi:hypothetical protein